MRGLTQEIFWLGMLVEVLALGSIAYASGILATKYGVKVNYTRKINHFAIFFLPVFIADAFPFDPTLSTILVNAGIFALALALLTKPVRTRSGVLGTIFASFDRPEDRPHTLLWLSTQVAAGYAVLIPLAYVLYLADAPGLVYVPILINGIGDGLAEPIGVRFGRHTYQVSALFSERTYSRSWEGSAAVFAVSVLVVIFFRDQFTPVQFWAALAAVPIAMTLAEARAPHTWDTPFLFLVGGAVPLAIVSWL